MPISGIKFFGADSGIVFAQNNDTTTVASTLDGGNTWKEQTSILHIGGNFTASDNAHMWFANEKNIYHSDNGSQTWSIDTLRDSIDYISALYFVDSMIGFAGSRNMMLFKTTDGGSQWKRVFGPDTSKLIDRLHVRSFSFYSEKFGVAAAGDLGTWILITTDGGNTWEQRITSQHTATGLSTPDSRKLFLCTSTQLFVSSDSGNNWNSVGNNFPLGEEFSSVSFIDSLHGIATGSGSNFESPMILSYTSDGGLTWKKSIIDSEGAFNDFTSFTNPSTAYAAGTTEVFKLNIKESLVPSSERDELPILHFDQGEFSIIMPFSEESEIQISDLLGRIIKKEHLNPDEKGLFPIRYLPHQAFIQVSWRNKFQTYKIFH
jgi:photosystem II stability/assembly factor-like uncharacterized protein